MKTCKLCDVAYIPELGHACDRGLEKLQVKDKRIKELEARVKEATHNAAVAIGKDEQQQKEIERLRGLLQEILSDGSMIAELSDCALVRLDILERAEVALEEGGR